MFDSTPERNCRDHDALAADLVAADAGVREQHRREKLGMRPGTPEEDAHLRRGRIRYLLARVEWWIDGVNWPLLRGAVSDYSLVLARFPDCVPAHVGRGEALLAFFGRERAALRNFDHALRLDPANVTALRARACTLMRVGVRTDVAGVGPEYMFALADADALLERSLFDPEAHVLRAMVHRSRALTPRCNDAQRGADFERAAAGYEEALRLGWRDIGLLNEIVAMLAWCVRFAPGSHSVETLVARMRRSYAEAVECCASSGLAHYCVGQAFAHLGHWQEAVEALHAAALFYPQSREIQDDIAEIEDRIESEGEGRE